MRVLAIECATEACSVALFDDGALLGNFHDVIGRGHAERLVPAIADLPGKGRADRILVSLGPGSFTGVRIGLATARALGLAWGADVRGYQTLALVAATAGSKQADEPVTVCMTGGHGEWFVQDYGGDARPQNEVRSLAPAQVADLRFHQRIVGSKASELATLLQGVSVARELLPDARHALELPQELLLTNLSPIYGRPPDARLPGAKA